MIDIDGINNEENKENGLKEKEFAWMEHSLSASPYSILRVGKDGNVIYANEASIPLLKMWGISKGERLPSNFMVFVRKALLGTGVQDIEIREKGYSLTFKSPGDGYVYIYGLDIASLQKDENEFIQEKEHESSSRSKQASVSADFRDLMDRTAKTVASTIKVDSCNIFKIFHSNIEAVDDRPLTRGNKKDQESIVSGSDEKEILIPAVLPQNSGSAAEGQRIRNGVSIQEIGSTGQISESDELAGGISVFLRCQGKICMVLTLYRTRPDGICP